MNRDKEVYNSSICIYCKNKNICDQNNFTVRVYRDRISMNCRDYEYVPESSLSRKIIC